MGGGRIQPGKQATPAHIARPRWRGFSLRYGDWKPVVSGKAPKQNVALYNIPNDPAEKTDLAKNEAGHIQEMQKRLIAMAKADRDLVVTERN